MKHIVVHKRFVKQFRKFPVEVQSAFQSRRDLFLSDETNPLLHIHTLTGKYIGYKSFNVNADIRVIFKEVEASTYLFIEIGSHSELYS